MRRVFQNQGLPFDKLRANGVTPLVVSLSNHERAQNMPFDKLRACEEIVIGPFEG